MAHKKRKLSRKELKRQRQEIVTRKREEKGWKPSQPKFDFRHSELLDDMLPLLSSIQSNLVTPADTEKLWLPVMDSADLAEEPELEGIIIDPLLCMKIFDEVERELGIEPEELEHLSEEEGEETWLEILKAAARLLLTKEVRQDILIGDYPQIGKG